MDKLKILYMLELTYLIAIYLYSTIWWSRNGLLTGGFITSRKDSFNQLFYIVSPLIWSIASTITFLITLFIGVNVNGWIDYITIILPIGIILFFIIRITTYLTIQKLEDNKQMKTYQKIDEWLKQFDCINRIINTTVYISNGKTVGKVMISVNEENIEKIKLKHHELPKDIYLDIVSVTKRERDLNSLSEYEINDRTSYYRKDDLLQGSITIIAPISDFDKVKEKSKELQKGIMVIITTTKEIADKWYKWTELEKNNNKEFVRFTV
jgi:hypothetical protein